MENDKKDSQLWELLNSLSQCKDQESQEEKLMEIQNHMMGQGDGKED